MPWVSRWMIGFGGVVLLCALVGWTSSDAAVRSGLGFGLAMIAAGAAAAQGRRSLRHAGLFAGIVLPIVIAAYCGWRAYDAWRAVGSEKPQLLAAVLLSIMSLGGVVTTLILIKLRSGDNIAERGYSIMPLKPPAGEAAPPQPPPRADRVDHR